MLKRKARLKHPGGHFLAHELGADWLLNHHNYVDRQLGVFRDFESRQIAALLGSERGPFDLFLDIGANFGLYCVLAAKRNVARSVVAFEPDPRNYAQLQANLYLNGLTQKVEARREAVSDKGGSLSLSLYSDNSTGKTRIGGGDQTGAGDIDVPCLALDEMLGGKDRSIAMKIDVEGHELSALQGMRRTLANNNCFIQVEIFPENAAAVDAEMAAAGYRAVARIDEDYYYLPADDRAQATAAAVS